MKRRDLFKMGGVAGLSLAVPGSALWAQKKPYREITPPLPRDNPDKIEVFEFFWYGCGHCFRFAPKVAKWKKSLSSDVVFAEVPVGWKSRRVNFEGHRKLFYTLEQLGVIETAHQKVFDALHLQKLKLDKDDQIFDFAESIELDREKFANVFNSFSVAAKVAKAKKLTEGYQIDGVPTFTVDGRFVTNETMVGTTTTGKEGASAVFEMVELLIKRQRQASLG